MAIVIRAGHGGTWQASAWWLERRYPDEFGRRDRVDLRIDVRREAERLAAEYGVDPDDIIAEADRYAERNR